MDVLMPQLGETVAEGKIVKWHKAAGDAVSSGDVLFEIETDKTSMEVPATSAGILSEIRVSEGTVAPVGAVVAVIGGVGAVATPAPTKVAAAMAILDPSQPQSPSMKAVVQPAQPSGSRLRGNEREAASFAYPDMTLWREVRTPDRNFGPGRIAGGVAVTPLARRLAGERGIELSRIKGSGPHGRIVAKDVEAAQSSQAVSALSSDQILACYRDVPFTDIPFDSQRREEIRRMSAAAQIPHAQFKCEVILDAALKACADINAAVPQRDGAPAYRISIQDIMLKALALALQRVPAANAVWANDHLLQFSRSDIAFATGGAYGPVVSVLHDVQAKSLGAISLEVEAHAAQVREGAHRPGNSGGVCLFLFAPDAGEISEFSELPCPPHSSVMTVGGVRRIPTEAEAGDMRFVSATTLTLVCDRRVIDLPSASGLLAAMRGFVERPVMMLV